MDTVSKSRSRYSSEFSNPHLIGKPSFHLHFVEPSFYERTKHIGEDYHYMCGKVLKGHYYSRDLSLMDIFTTKG